MSKGYFIVLGGSKDQLYLIRNIKKLGYKLVDHKLELYGSKIKK